MGQTLPVLIQKSFSLENVSQFSMLQKVLLSSFINLRLMFPFYTPLKPVVFWCYQEVQNDNIGQKWD